MLVLQTPLRRHRSRKANAAGNRPSPERAQYSYGTRRDVVSYDGPTSTTTARGGQRRRVAARRVRWFGGKIRLEPLPDGG